MRRGSVTKSSIQGGVDQAQFFKGQKTLSTYKSLSSRNALIKLSVLSKE